MQTKLSRYCEGFIEVVWLVAVISIPTFFNIYSSRIFEPDKVTIFRSLILFALCAWFIKTIEDGGVRWEVLKKSNSWIKTVWNIPMLMPVIGLVLVYIVATVFSISPDVSLWGSYQRLQGTYTTITYLVLFALVAGNMRKWHQVERLITTIIITSLPITLYGLLQRYGLDPIPWAGDTSTRIAANMGNSIFLAAYLIMVVPLTIGRLTKVFRKIWTHESQKVPLILHAIVYIFMAILQLVAIYFSQSRGPVMGLLAGVYVMALLFSFTSLKRWLSILVIGVAIVGGFLLLSFNLENGILKNLRAIPGVGRYGMLLDSESTTALSRKYIWQGTVDLVSIHDPLKFPDGATDTYNFLRPFFGYGPESMYVAYNQFYPPELGHVEKRNASPDRAHNETWDAMVTTGISGLLEYLLIFGVVFYYGVKWMGLARSKRDTYLFIFLLCLGGIGGSLGFSLWRGIEYLGIGLPFGILIGLVLYITITGLSIQGMIKLFENNQPRILVMVMLLTAMIAHFVEINFGIAIVVTRMLFWIYAALLFVVGYILPNKVINQTDKHLQSSNSILIEENKYTRRPGFVKQANAERSRKRSSDDRPSWKRESYIAGSTIGIMMVTLNYDFIINTQQNTSVGIILINSFTRLSMGGNSFSTGVLALYGITIFLGVLLFTLENDYLYDTRDWWKSFGASLAISAGLGVIVGIIFAVRLAALAQSVPQNQYDVLAQVGRIGGMLAIYYFSVAVISLLTAFLISNKQLRLQRLGSPLGILASPVFLILTIILVQMTNLRVVNADIAFKMAEPFVATNQWKMATLLYQRALELAPMEDHYYLFLGRSYLEQAKSAQDSQELDALLQQAENDLKIAQELNPLNTDHTANLARLYNWWASRANDTVTLLQRGNVASAYYATATSLSPNNMMIWGEWAVLNIQILKQPQQAFDLLMHAIEIDPEYSFTQGLMGDYYIILADTLNNDLDRKLALEQAAKYYKEAINVYNRRDTTPKVTYLSYLANTYIKLMELSDEDTSIEYNRLAITALEAVIENGISENELWKVQETLAQLYAVRGDKQNALEYAQLALSGASDEGVDRIKDLIIFIQAMP